MMELPELTQRIFHLNRVEGLSYSEIAYQLGIPEDVVKKHLTSALRHAMQCLRELEDD